MPSNETAGKIYNSTYRHGVDDKRRIQVPAMWRPDAENFQFTLILWPQHSAGPCLRVLPPKKMAEMMKALDEMPNTDRSKTVLKRIIGGSSTQVTLDKAGRICVPEEIARAAGIKEEVILVGLLDRFEIWNPERFESAKTFDSVMATEAFKMLE